MASDQLENLRSLLDRLDARSRGFSDGDEGATASAPEPIKQSVEPGPAAQEILPPVESEHSQGSLTDRLMSALAPQIRDASTARGDQIWREVRSEASRSADRVPGIAPDHRAPSERPTSESRPSPDPVGGIADDRARAESPLSAMRSTDPAPSIAPDGAPRDLSPPHHVVEQGGPASKEAISSARMPAERSEPKQSKPEDLKREVAKKDEGQPRPIRPVPAPTARVYPTLQAAGGEHKVVGDQAPNDSIRRPALFGWIIIALFFGVLGGWALFAPLHGAVVANGVIKVEGNRKSVQHLDGGIVKQLPIKEGDRVQAGDLLLLLDDTQARAEFQVLLQQFYVLRATSERLKTELARGDTLVLPKDLQVAQDTDPEVANIWKGQIQQFESRRTAQEGQRIVIGERIAQLESQIKGAEGQVKAYQSQAQSVQKELESIAPLVEKGLIATPRRLQLERSGSALEGQAAEAFASIAKARQAIAEQRQQMAQLDNERLSEVSKELKETQAKELETLSRLANARAVLSRTEIRAPYSGQVVGLSVFSIGGVIMRGEKILDLVPEQDSLVIEAQIAVEDISDVHPDMRADVHLTAYKQRITPVVNGTVIQVSADRLVDNKTNLPHYTAQIRLDEKQLAEIPHVKLYPGMPATVMIQTVERTALDYIAGPLIMSFNRAFRQK